MRSDGEEVRLQEEGCCVPALRKAIWDAVMVMSAEEIIITIHQVLDEISLFVAEVNRTEWMG